MSVIAPQTRIRSGTALVNGAEIYYEILGDEGPWAAVIQGGRLSTAAAQPLARAIASHGYRVVVHDRRNCGRSSLDFDPVESEEEAWTGDLRALASGASAILP